MSWTLLRRRRICPPPPALAFVDVVVFINEAVDADLFNIVDDANETLVGPAESSSSFVAALLSNDRRRSAVRIKDGNTVSIA